MPRQYETLWPDCKVKHLVLANDEFIVFIDEDGDVDWSTSSKYDEQDLGDRNERLSIVNEAARLEVTPCEGITDKIKIQFKRLIGEAIARSLDHDYVGAKQMLRSAEQYISQRGQETSRRWYLSASMAMAMPFLLFGGVWWSARGIIMQSWGADAFWVFMYAVAGATGALLSVIERSGRLSFDCSAGAALHWLEATSRIWAGAISGVVVGLAIRSGVILAVLARGERMPAVAILAALCSRLGGAAGELDHS